MTRREFITLMGGAAAAWPFAARAQQGERIPRVGMLLAAYSQADRAGQARIAMFLRTFRELGWNEGRDLRIEYRWAAGSSDQIKTHAAELVDLAPDIIVVAGILR